MNRETREDNLALLIGLSRDLQFTGQHVKTH
jgi:hypothetical protein